jgi:dGTPase
MIFTRGQLEELEDRNLASYAIRSSQSAGREHPEEERPYRTAFQRDRDRILHTTDFRRLKHKTQVFIVTEGDYYRTRLTHTLEVSQIGRTIARGLGANEDLVESICLAHDLGHPPFGHAGESALNELMEPHGGFDHNKQSFRIVTKLSERYPHFPGLNLTWEVREGIVKHETEYDIADAIDFNPEKRGHLEAQIANIADELAYTAHDLDDGLRSGMIVTDQLSGIKLWTWLCESVGWRDGDLSELMRHQLIRRLIGLEVVDALETSDQNLQQSAVKTVDELQLLSHNVVDFSGDLLDMNRQMKDFLYQYLYRHPRVFRMQLKAEQILTALFHAYAQNPEILPLQVQGKIKQGDLYRVICDYIAGMTDRFAIKEYRRLFDPQIQP